MERFYQDLSLGFRSLLRQPVVSFVAVLTLALGIGANVAMVSFARSTLFPDLPFENADRLVIVERSTEREGSSYRGLSYPAFLDWQARQRSFSNLSLLQPCSLILIDKLGDPERVTGLIASSDIFDTLGVEPILGRRFTSDEDRLGASPVVLLSFEFWQRRFGGDPEIRGRVLQLDGLQYTVIGVLAPGLGAESFGTDNRSDIWLPLSLIPEVLDIDDRRLQISDMVIVGRLLAGASVDSAQEDMARITEELATEYELTDTDKKAQVEGLYEFLVGPQRKVILVLVAMVAFLLIIVCVNLINLLLARFVARQGEFAVRMALGAGRRRLVIQGLNEALALALIGGLAGLVAAALAIRLLPVILSGVPYAQQARMSPSVLAFTALLCLAVTLVIGLIPSMQTISASWQRLLTSSLTSQTFLEHRRLRQLLVIGEIALATALMTGTVLALTSFLNQKNEDLGFSTDRVLTLEVELPLSNYPGQAAWVAYFDEALKRVGLLPEVEDVALTSDLPMRPPGRISATYADGYIPAISDRPVANPFTVSPDYFHVMGIRVVEGKVFTSHDDDRLGAKRVAMVSESMARELWPDGPAIGKQVGFEVGGKGTIKEPDVLWREVVGVVANVRQENVREEPKHTVYVPYTQRSFWYDMNPDSPVSPRMSLVTKMTVAPDAATRAVRTALMEIDPEQPSYGVRTLRGIVDDELSQARIVLVLLLSFAGMAVILALVGIYGMVSYIVTARIPEVGIRMALGASPNQIFSRLLLTNLVLILIGIAFGLVLVAAFTPLIVSQLYGVNPREPVAYLVSGFFLAVAALLATVIPALRAARVRPLDALRYE